MSGLANLALKQGNLLPDVVVVGAGPAGLTAALYLGRFHRRALVIDDGECRARWIPTSHNIPGFTAGIGGQELLSQLRAQAKQYGAEISDGRVSTIQAVPDGFALAVGPKVVRSRFVILATGVKDHFPELVGIESAVLRSVLRVCPICDGFEATGKRIAVMGDGDSGEHEAEFLFQTYSKDVTYLHLGTCEPARRARLEKLGVTVLDIHLGQLQIDRNALRLALADGDAEKYDVFYSALGCAPQHQLATELGATRDQNKALMVNEHQQTSIDGLYAAGDVVRGLNQVVIAAAEAAIAATDIHNRLRQQGRLSRIAIP
jgi:thioredoxin reductase (NADPH)